MSATAQRFLTVCSVAAALACPGAALAQATIKVGVLHSLSGTMAISETTLKDTILMLVDQQNKKGGLLGKKLEAVVVDPASNWPLFAEKASQLLEKDKVAVVFGSTQGTGQVFSTRTPRMCSPGTVQGFVRSLTAYSSRPR